MFNLLSGYTIDALQPYAMWITIGLAAAILIAGIILFFTNKELFKKFVKNAGICFVFYALITGILLLIFDVIKHYDAEYLEHNYINKDIIPYVFFPVLITLCLALISAVVMFVLAKTKPEKVKTAGIICGIICAVALLTSVITIALFYTNHIVGDGYYTEGYGELNSAALYVSAAILVVGTIVAALFLGRKDKNGFDTRCIAFAGITIALSFTLSYIKLWRMPQGGSVTLVSMLPIMLFSYVYGAKKGVLIGLIYGILQSLQDPYIVHPAQFLLDYPIAYAVTGLAGCLTYTEIFKKLPQLKFAIGAFIGALLRFASHVLSGVFAFGAYAKDAGASNAFTYSLVYNLVVLVDVALVIVVGIILFSSKSFNKELGKFNP
ncbi:MAG: energy-coupled thiamine transporter ThiT [Clostridia bacterium]|nr:energy-coupled thiamine transporter ThiT [Clostridia bacterium]